MGQLTKDEINISLFDEVKRLQIENEKLKRKLESAQSAITLCIETANNRESEWGDRAEFAFSYLYSFLEKRDV